MELGWFGGLEFRGLGLTMVSGIGYRYLLPAGGIAWLDSG